MFDRLIEVSGIHNPNELARTFIKNQEQNQNLLNFLKNLSEKRQIVEDEIIIDSKLKQELEVKVESERTRVRIEEEAWDGDKINSEIKSL